jgi:hypothetical protein
VSASTFGLDFHQEAAFVHASRSTGFSTPVAIGGVRSSRELVEEDQDFRFQNAKAIRALVSPSDKADPIFII